MKVNGSFALCAAVVVAMSATAASAFAFGGLFDEGLSRNIAAASRVAAADDSIFPNQALTMGRLEAASNYAKSDVGSRYSECASCAGDAAPAPVVYDAGIPSAVVYDGFVPYAPVVTYDYGFEYGYNVARRPVRSVVRPIFRFVDRVRPVRRVLNGVRNLFAGNSSYCRPAYVCDPCWSCADFCDPCAVPVCDPCAAPVCDPCWPCAAPVCDPCAPCGIPAAIAPTSVFAPRSCCGYGYYPGEVNELNAETGLPANDRGVPASVDSDAKSQETPSLSKRLTTDSSSSDVNAPAVPQYDSSRGLDASTGSEESVPTPAPNQNLGTGVIRMLVPEDSVVYVNGYRTKQTGALRSFAARQLELGETYSFEIRVVAVRDGRVYEDVQSTTLTAGDVASLAFNLKLNDSEVYAVNDSF